MRTGYSAYSVIQKQLALDEDINHYLPFKLDNPHTDASTEVTIKKLADRLMAL